MLSDGVQVQVLGVNPLPVCRAVGQHLLDVGACVQADRGRAQQLGATQGQQVGGTRSGTDEVNGHGVSFINE